MIKKLCLTVLFLIAASICFSSQVYVVLSSDTSIWWNLEAGRTANTYENLFDFEVFSDPEFVYQDVFEEDFRKAHTDSAGNPFKFTWFMHGGGWFDKGKNTLPASTTFQIRNYWSDELERWGDEIAYHFHHFVWNGSKWVMAPTFGETIWDFESTMSQMIIDESVYPVSFRSGWNYMDNEYQRYLDKWIPFRMEAAGWMSDCVPYHPSYDNYRVPGEMNGWEVRHYYMKSFTESEAVKIFQYASNGTPQVVCIWSHQNEGDFIQQLERSPALRFIILTPGKPWMSGRQPQKNPEPSPDRAESFRMR